MYKRQIIYFTILANYIFQKLFFTRTLIMPAAAEKSFQSYFLHAVLNTVGTVVSFKQNMNLKIQIFSGNTLMTRFHVGFEIELPLVITWFLVPEEVSTFYCNFLC